LTAEGIEPNPGPTWAQVVEAVMNEAKRNNVSDENLQQIRQALEEIGNKLRPGIFGRNWEDLWDEKLFTNLTENQSQVWQIAKEEAKKLEQNGRVFLSLVSRLSHLSLISLK